MLGALLLGRGPFLRLFAGGLLGLWQGSAIGAGNPDFGLAHVLATASYCAYAVNEADEDRGLARALACLNAAAAADPRNLGALEVRASDIEAYFAPDRPEDGYLLIRTRKGVIVAFRGTTPPPISRDAVNREAAAERRGHDLWGTFFADFFNNLDAATNERGRHTGFDDSWRTLWTHMQARCGARRVGADCSKFGLFTRSRGRSGAGARLFLTGHSKGGALAMLAGLDMPGMTGIAPVVYAFAAPKVVSEEVAPALVMAAGRWWRFEREDDLVPSLPPDRSVPITRLPFGSAYAKLGNLIYFTKSSAPLALTAEEEAALLPGDLARIPLFLAHQGGAVFLSWISPDFLERILNSNETACRWLVDNHFMVLSDVRKFSSDLGRASSDLRDADVGPDFFSAGLYAKNGEQILWGYREWCGRLRIVDRPTDQLAK